MVSEQLWHKISGLWPMELKTDWVNLEESMWRGSATQCYLVRYTGTNTCLLDLNGCQLQETFVILQFIYLVLFTI